MKHYRRPILIFIAVICLIFIYFIPSEHYILKSFFRIVPMVIILYYAIIQTKSKKLPIHILILIGFIFSISGDMVYYWPILEFIMAPAAILNGYILYSVGFLTQIKFSFIRFLTIIPIVIYAYILVPVLFKGLESKGTVFLIFFIMVYVIFIAIMCWSAFMTGNWWVILAALLFVISDTIRALNQFVSPGLYADWLIILPYFGAQFLIAHSMGTFKRKKKKIYPK